MITGATGTVGGKTLRLLREAGAEVRAVARRQDQVDRFAQQGIDAARADLDDVDALTRAFDGADQVMLLAAARPSQAPHGANVVRAAQRAGVRAIVQISASDATATSPIPWAQANWHTEQYVKLSGLEWTILRPSAYMDNLAQSAAAITRGFYPQTTGSGAIAWTDTQDVARVASTVLRAGRHTGQTSLITGPDLLTSAQVAATFSSVLGRPVRYVPLPSRVFAAAVRLGGADAWMAEGLRQQFARVMRLRLDHVDARTDDVQRITGHPATSLAAWIEAHRDHFDRRR
ncbi:SDR family oxidoreductase [Actinoplanes sp. NPDC048988]|uniref:SDR family oxidoreductase n=1 Tax=Actinoplanes sp. NPDC048988 TaxID=3363901 RepID=UPI003714B457